MDFKVGDKVIVNFHCGKCGYCFFCHLKNNEGKVIKVGRTVWVKFEDNKKWEFYSLEMKFLKKKNND